MLKLFPPFVYYFNSSSLKLLLRDLPIFDMTKTCTDYSLDLLPSLLLLLPRVYLEIGLHILGHLCFFLIGAKAWFGLALSLPPSRCRGDAWLYFQRRTRKKIQPHYVYRATGLVGKSSKLFQSSLVLLRWAQIFFGTFFETFVENKHLLFMAFLFY